jgi:hypothetical protein
MSKKLYTVEQANRALPYVRRVVEDLVAEHRRWSDAVRDLEVLAARERADAPDPRAEALRRLAQTCAADIDAFLGELAALGVECKGYDIGLVDFPAVLDGREVFLCWRLGEAAVAHWHDRDAGFAGRRPIPAAALAGEPA